MTTSTFSLAISPAPGRRDMRHVGNAELGVAVHGAVDHVDGIRAQQEIDEGRRRALPTLDLVLPHRVDEVVLRGGVELAEAAAAVAALAGAIDRPDGSAVEIRERWP